MGQYNLRFEQEEFTELVRLYSELAKIADRQMNEYQMILDIINTNAVISGELQISWKCTRMLFIHIRVYWGNPSRKCQKNLMNL